jgi:hypothetical protein
MAMMLAPIIGAIAEEGAAKPEHDPWHQRD